MQECLFCKIAKKELGTEFLYEDEHVVAFNDIDPKAPFHVLVVPKNHIESAAVLTEDEGGVLASVFKAAAELSRKNGYTNGYRVVTNVGKDGGQSVPHLHFHVLAGRALSWPPG